jgi:hypothetical protein
MRRIMIVSLIAALCAALPAFSDVVIRTKDGRALRVQVEASEIASIDFMPSKPPPPATVNPLGSWNNNNASTWTITKTPDGGYFATENGLGNAKGKAYFTPSGAFRIDYTWSGGSGFYEVRFAPDGHSAKGFANSPDNPCNWQRVDR